MPTPKKQPIKKAVPAKPVQPKGPFHFSGRNFNIIFILSVIGLCFVLYGNTIPNEFSLDDEFVIHNDTTVAKGVSAIPRLFKKRYAWDQKGGYGYRPVIKVIFAMEYAVFKDSPHWGHAINILLYAFICIFLFYFFRKIFYDHLSDYFLLTALVLFVTHPIHTEVVASLKNRDEMMVSIFGFYCCYAFLKCFETKKMPLQVLWALSGCISLGLATLCKPDGIIFLPITALVLYFFSPNGIKAAGIAVLCMAAFMLLGDYIIVNHVLPRTTYHRTFVYIENPLVGVYWYHKFPLAFSTVWFYTGKMFFPKDLVCYYGFNAFDAFPQWTDFSVIAGILLSGLLGIYIVKNIKKKSPLLFILLLFCGTLFPYTDLTQVGAGIVAERFMFIPSITFLLLITYLLYYILKVPVDKKPFGEPLKYVYAFTIVVCLIFTVRVIARNPDWKTHQSIYLHDSKVAPHSAKLQSLLAATYIEAAQKLKATDPHNTVRIDSLFEAGQMGYQNSVDIYPGYGTSWNNLGMIQYTLYGDTRTAISDFNKALDIDSDYSEAWFNSGACHEAVATKANDTLTALSHDSILITERKYTGQGSMATLSKLILACKSRVQYNRGEAEKGYLHTVKLKPNYYLAYIYITRLYFSEARYDKLMVFDSNAIENGHGSDVVYVSLGNAFLMKQDTTDAVADYEKSMAYSDRNYYICDFLKNYYTKKGDREKAKYYTDKYNTAMRYKNGRESH